MRCCITTAYFQPNDRTRKLDPSAGLPLGRPAERELFLALDKKSLSFGLLQVARTACIPASHVLGSYSDSNVASASKRSASIIAWQRFSQNTGDNT